MSRRKEYSRCEICGEEIEYWMELCNDCMEKYGADLFPNDIEDEDELMDILEDTMERDVD